VRHGDDVTRYATEMYARACGVTDLAAVVERTDKHGIRRANVTQGMPCAFCGRDDVDVGYAIDGNNAVVSDAFGDHMGLKEQRSSHACPWCAWVMRVGDLLQASGVIVWESTDDQGNPVYERRVLRGEGKVKEAEAAAIPGDPTIGRKEYVEKLLNPPPSDYLVFALNRTAMVVGSRGTHFLPGVPVNASRGKYLLSITRSRRETVLIDVDFLERFLKVKEQAENHTVTGKNGQVSVKKTPVDFYLLTKLKGFLNRSANPVSAWDSLPQDMEHMKVFQGMWKEITENRLALAVLFKLIPKN